MEANKDKNNSDIERIAIEQRKLYDKPEFNAGQKDLSELSLINSAQEGKIRDGYFDLIAKTLRGIHGLDEE